MNKPLRLAAATLLLGILGDSAVAQTQKTITFGSASTSSSKAKKKGIRKDYGRNSLTIGLASYFDGFTAVTYERMLNENFTVSAGAGITYKSFWMEVGEIASTKNPGEESDNHRGENQWDIRDDYSDFTNRRAGQGIYLSLSPKYYPGGESLDGRYIAPLIEYRSYRFNADAPTTATFRDSYTPMLYADDVPRGAGEVAENVRCLDLSAVFGGHFQLRGHIVIAYQVGLGMRNMKATRQDLGFEQVAKDTYQFTNKTVSYNDTRLIGQLGFSVGGWW